MPRLLGFTPILIGMTSIVLMVIGVGCAKWAIEFNQTIRSSQQAYSESFTEHSSQQITQRMRSYSLGLNLLARTILENGEANPGPKADIPQLQWRMAQQLQVFKVNTNFKVRAVALLATNIGQNNNTLTVQPGSTSAPPGGLSKYWYAFAATTEEASDEAWFQQKNQSENWAAIASLLDESSATRQPQLWLDELRPDVLLLISPLNDRSATGKRLSVSGASPADAWVLGFINSNDFFADLIDTNVDVVITFAGGSINDPVSVFSTIDSLGEDQLNLHEWSKSDGAGLGEGWTIKTAISQTKDLAPLWPSYLLWVFALTVLLFALWLKRAISKNTLTSADQQLENEQKLSFFRVLLDGLPPAVVYVDAQSNVQFANAAFCRLFNKSEAQLKQGVLLDHAHPALRNRMQQSLDKALSGEHQVIENNYDNGRGGLNCVVSRVIPNERNGEVIGLTIISFDSSDLIASQKELLQAIRKNEALMQTINGQLLFGILDADGVLMEVNEYACQSVGISRHKMLGKTLDDETGAGLDRIKWAEAIRVAQSGQIWRGEILTKAHDGQPLYLQGMVVPAYGDNNRLENIYTLAMNTTRAQMLLRERDRLNQLFQSVLSTDAGIGIITTDERGVITLFNRGAELLFGYSSAELVNKEFLAGLLVNEDEVKRLDIPASSNGHYFQSLGNPVVCCHKEGSIFCGQITTSNLYDDENKISGHVVFVKDISEELAFQQQLLEKTDQLEIASEVAGLGVWTWDTNNDYFTWNNRMYEIFEETRESLAKPNAEYLLSRSHPNDRFELRASMARAQVKEGRYDMDFRVFDKKGDLRHLRAQSSVEQYPGKNQTSATGIVIDITEQLQQEQKLRHAIDEADTSSNAKTRFLANMSHEIRTPLNAVLGMLQLLRHTNLDTHQTEYTANATVAAQSLLELLNSILDFSKIEARKLELDVHSFALDELFQDLAVIVCANQKHSKVRILFDLPLDLPSKLMGDSMRLKQVLLNLIGNAVKFTSHGYVQLKVVKVRDYNKKITLRFEINDTGIGISKQQQARLFTGFAQAEVSTTRKYGGTGLGLAISKRLVDLLGGRLNLLSDLGQGAQFWFDLSFPAPDDTPISGDCEDLRDYSAIIINDDPVLTRLLSNQLVRLGFLVKVFGETEIIERFDFTPSFVFVAYKWSVPSTVSQWLDEGKTKVIILLTLSDEAPEEALALSEPFLPSQILRVLRQAINPSGSDKPAKVSADKRLQGLHVLVVEDNLVNREVARRLLEFEGATVALAECGEQGVAMVLNADQSYDVVLMDIQMPDIDGLEACRRIRADQRHQQLPILALTANASNDDRDQCIAAGMNGHLTKPMVIDVIVANILALVRKSPMDDKSPQIKPAQQSEELEEIALVDDFNQLAGRFGSNNVLLAMVLNKFTPEVRSQMADLKEQIANGDGTATKRTLHSLKGVAATVGAIRLSQRFGQLEAALKAQPDLPPNSVLDDNGIVEIEQLVKLSDNALRQLFIDNGVDIEPSHSDNP